MRLFRRRESLQAGQSRFYIDSDGDYITVHNVVDFDSAIDHIAERIMARSRIRMVQTPFDIVIDMSKLIPDDRVDLNNRIASYYRSPLTVRMTSIPAEQCRSYTHMSYRFERINPATT